jgi:hypothetical protein
MYGEEEGCIQDFGGEDLKETNPLDDPGVDGKTK